MFVNGLTILIVVAGALLLLVVGLQPRRCPCGYATHDPQEFDEHVRAWHRPAAAQPCDRCTCGHVRKFHDEGWRRCHDVDWQKGCGCTVFVEAAPTQGRRAA